MLFVNTVIIMDNCKIHKLHLIHDVVKPKGAHLLIVALPELIIVHNTMRIRQEHCCGKLPPGNAQQMSIILYLSIVACTSSILTSPAFSLNHHGTFLLESWPHIFYNTSSPWWHNPILILRSCRWWHPSEGYWLFMDNILSTVLSSDSLCCLVFMFLEGIISYRLDSFISWKSSCIDICKANNWNYQPFAQSQP